MNPENIRKTDDLLQMIPKYMVLPIVGFKNKNYHCFVTTDHFIDLIKRSTLSDNSIYAAGIVSTALNIGSIGKTIDNLNEGNIGGLFLWRLFKNMEVLAQTLKRFGYLFSVHFYGVQAEYGGMGFTEFRDNMINSFVSQDFHTVLNPYEYIIYGHPVHATADGEVVEIINKYPDKPKYNTEIRMRPFTSGFDNQVEDYMGNKITIKHNNVIHTVYANIKKDSFLVRVGDHVKRGQTICKVGCSGTFRDPFLFFGITTGSIKLPLISTLRIPFHATSGIWMPFQVSNLLDIENEFGKKSYDFYRRLDMHKIQYKFGGTTLRDCSFIRQTPTIAAE